MSNALFAELQSAGVLHDVSRAGVRATGFGTSEFATLDSDGNLLTLERRLGPWPQPHADAEVALPPPGLGRSRGRRQRSAHDFHSSRCCSMSAARSAASLPSSTALSRDSARR